MDTEHNIHIVYLAKNKGNGKVYIGTTTKSVEERKNDHIQKSNKGLGSYFQKAIGTYGPEAFSWEQIDTANDNNDLAEKEKKYILTYDSMENGYNKDSGGGFKKKVYQYRIEDGELIGIYDDLPSAANAVNAVKQSISKVCSGENRTCKGFYWSYSLTEPYIIQKDKRRKELRQYDQQGGLIAKYKSVSEAARITGISKTCISRCCRGEREQTGGFLWKYI
jgi:group I intron endonuclease